MCYDISNVGYLLPCLFWSNSLTHRLVCRTTCSEEFPRKPQAPTSSFHTSRPHCKPTYVGPSSLADDYLVKDKQVLNNSMKYIKYRLGPLQIIIHGIKRVKMIGTPNILCITLGNRDPKTRTELFQTNYRLEMTLSNVQESSVVNLVYRLLKYWMVIPVWLKTHQCCQFPPDIWLGLLGVLT